MVLAGALVMVAPSWINRPTLLPSTSARVKSLGTHLVYGAGLYLSAVVLANLGV